MHDTYFERIKHVLGVSLLLAGISGAAQGSDEAAAVRLEIGGNTIAMETWEHNYLLQALKRLETSCAAEAPDSIAVTTRASDTLTAVLEQDKILVFNLETGPDTALTEPTLTRQQADEATALRKCEPRYTAPIVAIIQSKRPRPGALDTAVIAGVTPADTKDLLQEPAAAKVQIENTTERLTAFEQNSLGWTRDDNSVDSGYMDAHMSFKFRAWDGGEQDRFSAFFAFSTHFSQYIETIESSPVVGKRYNPMGFLRTHFDARQGYVDLGLAHESNGQSISTEEAYLAERQKYADSDGEPDFARNSISRGWDYVFADWTHCWRSCSEDYAFDGIGRFTTGLEFQYYLDDGPFQGNPEEFNDWEGDSERKRKEYDGIGLSADYRINSGCLGITGFACSISWEYRTGYDGIFDRSTNRVQIAVDKFWVLPAIGFWAQTGYNSNLVDYYKSVDSFGIALLFSNPY